MRVFLAEVRKLLWLRNLLIAAVIGALYYVVFVWQLVELMPNGHPATEAHQFAIAWHQRFGPTVEPAEAALIQAELDQLIEQADAAISADPVLSKAGIDSWQELGRVEELTDQMDKARWSLLFGTGGLGWQLHAMEGSLGRLGPLEPRPEAAASELARVEQINQSEEWRNLQSGELIDFLRLYPAKVSTLVFLVVLLVTSPLVTSDRVARLPQLQATTLTGRRLRRQQFAAVMSVSALTSAVLIGATSVPLTQLGFIEFWNTGIQSFNGGGRVFPSVTLGQHSLLLATLALLSGLLAGLTGFALSCLARTYQALALANVAVLAAALWLIPPLTENAFGYDSLPAALWGTPWAPLAIWTALTGLAVIGGLVLIRRHRRGDIDD